jgi:hypothetical protein
MAAVVRTTGTAAGTTRRDVVAGPRSVSLEPRTFDVEGPWYLVPAVLLLILVAVLVGADAGSASAGTTADQPASASVSDT